MLLEERAAPEPEGADLAGRPVPAARTWRAVEALAVLASPALAYIVLRIRAMAPVQLPDPSMHTIYIVDPRQMFDRYAAAFASTARMREGAQAGFLVLARLSYLAFGALGGFFVFRYVLALVAVVPAYLLLRRLYGAPAGAIAAVVLLSCPVVLTAWGTDYPDSAVVSYLAGAVACLAMPCARRRRGWIVGATVLLTLAVWSHGIGIVLTTTTVVVYAAVRWRRDRGGLGSDLALMALAALATTFALMVASRLVLGQFDFIVPTFKGAAFLNKPSQVRLWHSANWRWAPYVAYLLVPPAVIVSFAVVFWRRLREVPTPQLLVGLMCAVQFAVFVYLQFGYHVQALEMYYFSSTLWGVVCVALAVLLAQSCSGFGAATTWLAVLALVAVPLAYEADPHVPAFGWLPWGAVLAVMAVLAAAAPRLFHGGRRRRPAALGVAAVAAVLAAVVAVSGALLVLTVAPRPKMPHLTGLAGVGADPSAAYADALGGSATGLIEWYEISTELPHFVGDPAYYGEELLMWAPQELGVLLEPIGMFHAGFDLLPTGLAQLTDADLGKLARRRPAELLLLSTTGDDFPTALHNLRFYAPVLLRTTVLRDGGAVLHAWLLRLGVYARPVTA